ncbi:MAG: hypothetical protein B7Y02_11030 [Rhodobacterales bacterium 17-64-5]|nr:MAG: hypothetical protein B7Y02_11030 [Rhodobacterales bacterium 17-64-5]
MTTQQIAEDAVQVTLVAAGSQASLAARALTHHFGLRVEETEVLLMTGKGMIAPAVPEPVARAAQPLLAALGLQIAILPYGAKAEPELYDLSIRAAQPDCALAVLQSHGVAADITGAAGFSGPSGLVIAGLSQGQVEALRVALLAVEGVQVVACAVSAARYDLFGALAGEGRAPLPLRRHLSMLGYRPDHATSALACDLDLSSLKHVLSRFPECGLTGVNQAFQRYQVTVTGPGRLTRQEMLDFLATRGISAEHLAASLQAGRPLQIDSGLGRATIRQFLADYALIGLPVRAELTHA